MRRAGRGLVWVVGIVVALWLVSASSNSPRGPDPTQEARLAEAVDAERAWRYCQDAVRARLKAPSTARFPGREAVDGLVVKGSDGTVAYQVVSYVDAQNSFGAMIRTQFECVARKLPDGRWEVSAVRFEFRKPPKRRRGRSGKLSLSDLLRALRLTEADLPALRDLFATLHDLGLPPHQAAAMVRVAAGKARWPLLEQDLVYLRHLGISLDDEGEAEARMLLQLAREVRRRRWSVPQFVAWAMHQMKKEGVTMPRDFTDYHDPLPGALDVRFRWEQEDGVRWPD